MCHYQGESMRRRACLSILLSGIMQVPMHLVFGKPIEVPIIKDPSKQQTQEYLDKYITAMTELYHRHKDANGYSDVKLEVA